MINSVLPTIRFDLPLLGALSPTEKWKALQRDSGGGGRWLIWVLGIVAVVVGVVIVVALVKYLLAKRSENKFKELCGKMSLNPEEVKVLTQIVTLSGLQSGAGIFFSASAFETGVEKLMYSGQVGALSPDDRLALCNTAGAVQDKLKFSGEGKSTSGLASSRKIPEGSELSVSQHSGEKPLKARLVSSNQIEFTIESAEAVPARQGIPCLINYVEKDENWEFDCVVAHSNSEKKSIILVHSNRGRLLNRRRFPRVPTVKVAHIVQFPFSEEAGQGEPDRLDFEKAILVEIAGPGFKLRTKLQAKVEQKVLVVMEAKEKTIKSLAIVRQSSPSTEGQDEFEIAVELTGLDATEVAVLLRETNEAQRQLARKSESVSSETIEPVPASEEN